MFPRELVYLVACYVDARTLLRLRTLYCVAHRVPWWRPVYSRYNPVKALLMNTYELPLWKVEWLHEHYVITYQDIDDDKSRVLYLLLLKQDVPLLEWPCVKMFPQISWDDMLRMKCGHPLQYAQAGKSGVRMLDWLYTTFPECRRCMEETPGTCIECVANAAISNVETLQWFFTQFPTLATHPYVVKRFTQKRIFGSVSPTEAPNYLVQKMPREVSEWLASHHPQLCYNVHGKND